MSKTVHNCTRDEGGPFGFGDQESIPSHRVLLRPKSVVVSVAENAGTRFRQARSREASAGEPLQNDVKALECPPIAIGLPRSGTISPAPSPPPARILNLSGLPQSSSAYTPPLVATPLVAGFLPRQRGCSNLPAKAISARPISASMISTLWSARRNAYD